MTLAHLLKLGASSLRKTDGGNIFDSEYICSAVEADIGFNFSFFLISVLTAKLA